MRGEERRQRPMLMVVNAEQRVPKEHPLGRSRRLAGAVPRELSPLFDRTYRVVGTAVDSARAAFGSLASDGALHDAPRAHVL